MSKCSIELIPVDIVATDQPELHQFMNAVATVHKTTPLIKVQCDLLSPNNINFQFNTVSGMKYEQDIVLLEDGMYMFNFKITGNQWKNDDSGARIRMRDLCVRLIKAGLTGIKIKLDY